MLESQLGEIARMKKHTIEIIVALSNGSLNLYHCEMKFSAVVLFVFAAEASAKGATTEAARLQRHSLRRILKQNQQQTDNKNKDDKKPANSPEQQPATNAGGNVVAANYPEPGTATTITLDGSSATDTTAEASAETSAPASAPGFIPVPVAAYAPVYIPKNCCEFNIILSELDSACHNAVREGRVALSHQAFESNDFSCEVPPKSILALQDNLKIARINYLNFLTLALQQIYPGVNQNCFGLHLSSFTFSCEDQYIDGNTFKTKRAPVKSLDAIEDYLCCATPQPPILNDALPNIAQTDQTKRWCGGTLSNTAPARCS
jgi:hypothetical protein